jgi:hypothetical protein
VRQMITRCPHCGVTLRKFKTPVVLFSPSVAFGRISPDSRFAGAGRFSSSPWRRRAGRVRHCGVTATVERELLRPDRSVLRWGSSR